MDDVEKIKTSLSLKDIIGETVELKSAGKNRFKGLCPFHSEKTPSFHVDADKGTYKCFGCGESGDHFTFVQKTESLDFRAALELLAQRAGVELQDRQTTSASHQTEAQPSSAKVQPEPAPETQPEEPLEWIDDFVTEAHNALKRATTRAAENAMKHFERRGLAHLIDDLKLGVVDETVRLAQTKNNKHLFGKLKRLQGRAVIPTLDGGKAIWFKARDVSGRSADELKQAEVKKYDGPSGTVPAPFNPVGLEHAVKVKFLVLTEGEADAASMLAAYGLNYPVMGLPGGNIPISWTERIAAIKIPVYAIMDADPAGEQRAERIREALSGLGVRCYLIRLPNGDLNDLLIADGPDGLVACINDLIEVATLDSMSDLLYIRETWLAELDARAIRPHAVYTTGMAALDELLEEGYSEGLHLLGGITGGGKTSLALQIALHNALAGRPVIYATYEQSRLELWARIASRLTNVPYKAIKRGVYDDHGQTLLTSSVLKAHKVWPQLETISKNLKIVEGGDALSRQTSAYTTEVLAQTAQSIVTQHGAPPLIIIDYLQRAPIPAELKIRDVRERVGYIAGLLQVQLAREVGCPVLALSSIGRSFYNLQKLPSLEERIAAFKEAGEIEYTAYTSLLVYGLAEELQDRVNLRPGMIDAYKPMVLDLVKNREGNIGQIGVKWHAARSTWTGAVALKGTV